MVPCSSECIRPQLWDATLVGPLMTKRVRTCATSPSRVVHDDISRPAAQRSRAPEPPRFTPDDTWRHYMNLLKRRGASAALVVAATLAVGAGTVIAAPTDHTGTSQSAFAARTEN